MPTLNWIGKEKVVSHHHDVPFRVLEHKYRFDGKSEKAVSPSVKEKRESKSQKVPSPVERAEGEVGGNKIIHGDNLEALKSLLPEYEGKIKCIYIDPPYNTGNENWVYNDNVNHPKIKKWLEKTINAKVKGDDASIGIDDLARHDKWLCMMYPRLQLLYKLLDFDGIIFISIDDNELAHLKLILDEIFGPSNFIEYFSWIKTSTPPSLAKKSRKTTEYILCYEKRRTDQKYEAEEGDGGDAPLLNSGNALVELTFPKSSLLFKLKDGNYQAGQYDRVVLVNDIIIKNGCANSDIILKGEFKWTQETLNSEITNGTSFVIKSDKFSIRYLRTSETSKAPTNLLKEKYFTPVIDKKNSGVETNEGARKELNEIFQKSVFDYPKPSSLIKFLLGFMSDKNGIVLDSFAGSGTTAHAVLNLNKQDGGNRKFILIEMEDYAETITAERVKRVIKGYGDVEGTGGSFDYLELGKPLFTGDNNEYLNEEVSTEKIRQYVWYSETRTAYELADSKNDTPYFLGKLDGTAYYFIYEKNELTTLDYDSLATIKNKSDQYIIYADNCLLPKEFMMKHNIVFKKIPRDISRF
jgi:adenine-specific DNA-methyltransferase